MLPTFTPFQHAVADRNADYHRIETMLPMRPPKNSTSHGGGGDAGGAISCSAHFDACVFLGDLNYRVAGCRAVVDALLSPPTDAARKAMLAQY